MVKILYTYKKKSFLEKKKDKSHISRILLFHSEIDLMPKRNVYKHYNKHCKYS